MIDMEKKQTMSEQGISYIGGTADKDGFKVTSIELTQKKPDANVILTWLKEEMKE
jgi:hypothetical protein